MAKKRKLPKRVLGAKIPKNLRRGPLAQMLTSPAGQGVLAAALYQVAATIARSQAREGSVTRTLGAHPVAALGSAGAGLAGAGSALGSGTARLSHAFNAGLRHFLEVLKADHHASAPEVGADDAGEDKRKERKKKAISENEDLLHH